LANELCWAKSYCKKYGSSVCHQFCDVYVLLKAIYSQTNIPKKYQYDRQITPSKKDVEAYKQLNAWKEDVVNKVESGENLFIWSTGTGNGKTTWATKIANYFIRKSVFKKEIENLVVYVNVPTFLEQLRASYDQKLPEVDLLKERLLNAKLAILDDIGAEKSSAWVVERLYEIINYRDNEMLSTIYTSNVSIQDLEDRLDKRITSRIKNSTQIELVGQDRRERRR